jgi:hypothetical protein
MAKPAMTKQTMSAPKTGSAYLRVFTLTSNCCEKLSST